MPVVGAEIKCGRPQQPRMNWWWNKPCTTIHRISWRLFVQQIAAMKLFLSAPRCWLEKRCHAWNQQNLFRVVLGQGTLSLSYRTCTSSSPHLPSQLWSCSLRPELCFHAGEHKKRKETTVLVHIDNTIIVIWCVCVSVYISAPSHHTNGLWYNIYIYIYDHMTVYTYIYIYIV